MWVKLMSKDEHVTHLAKDLSGPSPDVIVYQDRTFVFVRVGKDMAYGHLVNVRIYHEATVTTIKS